MTAAARLDPAAAGAPAPALETVLVVPGMHCAGCMAKVEHGLAAVPGVSAARVNLTARQVSVTHKAELPLPVLIETARLWMSLGHHDRHGVWHLDGVTGPDEYTAIVRDNSSPT